MKRITQELYEQAHEYLHRWVQDEKWDDLAIMLMEGDTELASYRMCSTGAICPDSCYSEYKKIQQAIVIMSERVQKLSDKQRHKRYDDVFVGVLTVDCSDCNNVSFVHSGNEELYPEVLECCWECKSKNIESSYWKKGE